MNHRVAWLATLACFACGCGPKEPNPVDPIAPRPVPVAIAPKESPPSAPDATAQTRLESTPLQPDSAPAPVPAGSDTDQGVGVTADEALRDAFRNAVRRVVGAYVDAETLVRDDHIISDQILTHSDGFIERYDLLGSAREGDVHRVRIRAAVVRRDVVTRLQVARVPVTSVDGAGLFAPAVTTREAEESAARMIRRTLSDFPANVIAVTVTSQPRLVDTSDRVAKIAFEVRVKVDVARYDQLMTRVVPLLRSAAIRTGELDLALVDRYWDGRLTGLHRKMLGDDWKWKVWSPGPASRARRPDDVVLDDLRPCHLGTLANAPGRASALDPQTQMRVLVNTARDDPRHATTWRWIDLPRAELFSTGGGLTIKYEGTALGDNIPFGTRLILPGLFASGKGVSSSGDFVAMSPYLLDGRDSATAIEWTVERQIPLAELQKVTAVKCRVRIAKPAG